VARRKAPNAARNTVKQTPLRTRAEHVAWCKQQALAYLDQGDVPNAVASMLLELNKHPETKTRDLTSIRAALGMHVILSEDKDAARSFIEGF
jgi:hypothetical protein